MSFPKSSHSPWDHPRACGEQEGFGMYSGSAMGSSPRVRGTARWWASIGNILGIIPARAGNRLSCHSCADKVRDHPRACGEQTRVAGSTSRSPWIIPARAGNSAGVREVLPTFRDHPRACGEQPTRGLWRCRSRGSSPRVRGTAFSIRIGATRTGSSPRVRGTGARELRHRADHRIIPARAGNSHVSKNDLSTNWDHPRACGEQSIG